MPVNMKKKKKGEREEREEKKKAEVWVEKTRELPLRVSKIPESQPSPRAARVMALPPT